MMPSASRRSLAVLAAALGMAILAAPTAQAFTLQESGVSNGDGTRSAIVDPDRRFSGTGSTSQGGSYSQGNTSIQFGGRPSFEQRYDTNRMFNPLARPGEDR